MNLKQQLPQRPADDARQHARAGGWVICHEMTIFCREMESTPRAKYFSVENDPPASLLPKLCRAVCAPDTASKPRRGWPLAGLLRTTIDDADCGLFKAVS